jgi:hypothetical protein
MRSMEIASLDNANIADTKIHSDVFSVSHTHTHSRLLRVQKVPGSHFGARTGCLDRSSFCEGKRLYIRMDASFRYPGKSRPETRHATVFHLEFESWKLHKETT